jgi:hypothetical protein
VKSPDFTAYIPHVSIIGGGYGSGYEADLEVKSAVLAANFDPEELESLPHTHALVVPHLLFHIRYLVLLAITELCNRAQRCGQQVLSVICVVTMHIVA